MSIRTQRLRRPSPAMVVALIALFVALSGGAAAGTYVAAKQRVAPSLVIDRATASTARVAVTKAALRARLAQLHSSGPRGPRGRRGPRGFRGPQGPAGPSGVAHTTSRNGPVAHMCAFGGGACSIGQSIALCPTGTVPIAGAWAGDAPDPIFGATISASFPYPSNATPTGWAVVVVNDVNATASFHASVICAS